MIPVNQSFFTTASVFYDAVYVPGGTNSVGTLADTPDAVHFLNEAYRHCKAIAGDEDALPVFESTYFSKKLMQKGSDKPSDEEGVIIGANAGKLAKQFIAAIATHRFWDREANRKVPA